MRVRHLFLRTRPFRYAGFWSMAVVCLAAGDGEGARSLWQVAAGAGFCGVWPSLADRLQRRLRRQHGGCERLGYVAESGLAALVLGWACVPPLAALATALCLLAGATALAGWRLGLAAGAAAGSGAGLGLWLTPRFTAQSTPAADALALLLLTGFTLALAALAFRQARRLDAQRVALAERSAALERLNDRMQRYLPPSLRRRLAQAPDAPWRWERRWLTVAFVDLVGFTSLAERLDAELLARLLDDYLAALAPAAEARHGEISKVMGDGVLVAFGLHDGGDRRACAAAALDFCGDVAGLLAGLAGRWHDRGEPVTLRVRAGIASGYCTLGDRGGTERLDFTLVGPPVNLASRLQAHAPADGLLADAATAALAEPSAGLGPPRCLSVKGMGPVAVHERRRPRTQVDPPAASAIVPAPFP